MIRTVLPSKVISKASRSPLMEQVNTKPVTQSFTLDVLPPTMNEIVAMAKSFKKNRRCSPYDLAKKRWNLKIGAIIQREQLKPFTTPVWVHLRFFVNKRIDRDNLRACQKFILDGMVSCKFIVSDGRNWVDITYKEDSPLDGVVVEVTISDKPIYKQVLIEY